jgi:uncharacterized protein (TIGR02118 family)
MTKVRILFRKRADLAMDEFHRYWQETHGPIAATMPGLQRYIQDRVLADPPPQDRPYDAVAELWFESAESFHAAIASPEGQATMADATNFADMDSVRLVFAEEVIIT